MCQKDNAADGFLTTPSTTSFAKQLDRNIRKLQYYLSQVQQSQAQEGGGVHSN